MRQPPPQPADPHQQLADLEQRYRHLAAQLADIGLIQSGSLALRDNTCGKPSCRCHADPPQPHGPYWQWTTKVKGKTINRRLTPAQATIQQQWIANDRQLHATIQQMRDIAAQAIELHLTQATQV